MSDEQQASAPLPQEPGPATLSMSTSEPTPEATVSGANFIKLYAMAVLSDKLIASVRSSAVKSIERVDFEDSSS